MGRLKLWTTSLDQDWIDTANGFWSVLLLAVCSMTSFLFRYVASPISCWTPLQFTGSQVLFATNTCFMKEEYYPPAIDIIPGLEDQIKVKYIPLYHLWIPFILFIQALCFKIPNVCWNLGKHSLGFNLGGTVEALHDAQSLRHDTSPGIFKNAARMYGGLLSRNNFLLCILYLLVKFLYLVNLFGQLVFLTIYFHNSLAIRAGSAIGVDVESIVQPLLTKSVMCDYNIRSLGRTMSFSIMCMLPICEAYEKMFVVLWYWVALLAVLTLLSLLLWAAFLVVPFLRDNKLAAFITSAPGTAPNSAIMTRFISGFLGIDGVWMLSMIAKNSSELVAAQLTQEMFQVFMESCPTSDCGPSGVQYRGQRVPQAVAAPPQAASAPPQATSAPPQAASASPTSNENIPLQEVKAEKTLPVYLPN